MNLFTQYSPYYHLLKYLLFLLKHPVVGIATHYRLHCLGIKSRWGARFSAHVQTGHGVHQASYTIGTRSFLGVKQLGCGVDHPHPSSTEVKERVGLYLHSTLGLHDLFWGELILTLYIYIYI
jgi:hypothetical protein